MKKIFFYAIGVLAVLVIALAFRGGNNAPQVFDSENSTGTESESAAQDLKIGGKIGDLAPDFALKDYEGNKVKLSDFKGEKGVFLNFWATWCPFCVNELPLMGNIQEKHKGQYVTLAVNRAENRELAKDFSDKLGVTGKMIFLLDPGDLQYFKYGGFAMPFSIFIDKNGVIKDLKFGPLTEQELENKVQKII